MCVCLHTYVYVHVYIYIYIYIYICVCDGFKIIMTILGRNPDKSRNPYKNKVAMIQQL